MKNLVCIVCPRGCKLAVNEEDFSVGGASCKRGETYGRDEIKNPLRTLTTTVPVQGAAVSRCPVKTRAPIPKPLMFKAMEALADIRLNAPVSQGEIVLDDLCATGIPVIATRNL